MPPFDPRTLEQRGLDWRSLLVAVHTLTEEDNVNDQHIVVAIREIIRLMAEKDEVIKAHGGWRIRKEPNGTE